MYTGTSNINILSLYNSVVCGLVIFINLKPVKTDINWLFLLGPGHKKGKTLTGGGDREDEVASIQSMRQVSENPSI